MEKSEENEVPALVLIERLKSLGYNPEETVYSLTLADVADCLADVKGDCSEIGDEELKDLVGKAVKGTEYIDWWTSIKWQL